MNDDFEARQEFLKQKEQEQKQKQEANKAVEVDVSHDLTDCDIAEANEQNLRLSLGNPLTTSNDAPE